MPIGRGGAKVRIAIALILIAVSLGSYLFSSEVNPITGESQRVGLSQSEEIALGLQAAPELLAQYGGPHDDGAARSRVESVGAALLAALDEDLRSQGRETPYPFTFHLLADAQTVNAFALPGGQVFITAALYNALTTEGQLAGVLGHEIGHVLSRHGAQQLAKRQLTEGLAGAAGVAAGDMDATRMAQMVGQFVNMSYGRDHELEADRWGVRLTGAAGYDPRAMIGVMEVLDRASGGGGPPEFLSTHPKPANRVNYINQVIEEAYPNGVPSGLKP